MLFVVSGFLGDRGVGARSRRSAAKHGAQGPPAGRRAAAGAAGGADPVHDGVDAEMAEIEAILRKRGIT